MRSPDQLHQLHHQSGVEVVNIHQPLRMLRYVSQLGADDIGGVGGQHRIGPTQPADAFEQLPLHIQLLNDRLDHQIALGGGSVYITCDGEIRLDVVHLLLGQAALGNAVG